ncbi:MAG: hypothetical protein HQK49_13790 [Oligoflexia bacterium]|nr:hypothetical protein [Oligoflexia bacterium]
MRKMIFFISVIFLIILLAIRYRNVEFHQFESRKLTLSRQQIIEELSLRYPESAKYVQCKRNALVHAESKLKKISPVTFSSLVAFTELSELNASSTFMQEKIPYFIFRNSLLPEIFVFLYHDLCEIGLVFDRMNYFVETSQKKISSMDDFEITILAGYIGGAYDFRLSDVAQFFNEVRREKISLNPFEERLLSDLLQLQLFKIGNDQFIPTISGAVLGIMKSSPLAEHEFNHAIYFVNADYRKSINDFFRNLPDKEKKIVLRMLNHLTKGFAYNFEHDSDLLVREFAAYFRSPDIFAKYFLCSTSFVLDEDSIQMMNKIAKQIRLLESNIPYYREFKTLLTLTNGCAEKK